jgi:hypothetical protein
LIQSASVDEEYFNWLYKQVWRASDPLPERSNRLLAEQLHTKPFRWYVDNDDNRAADGVELRLRFLDETKKRAPRDWLELDCSVLEMIIALAGRTAFNSYGTTDEWAAQLLTNLGILRFTDAVYNHVVMNEVDEVLETLLDRTYSPDGVGGLFPLRMSRLDQRRVELWNQMQSYVIEGETVANGP